MAYFVTLEDFTPSPRKDGTPWTQARIEEAPAKDGPWAELETQALAPLDPDPADPQSRSFSSGLGQLRPAWYRIVFIDAGGHQEAADPVYSENLVYTSVADVRQVLSPGGSTAETLGTAASLGSDQIAESIAEAANEINARLASRYDLPFAAPVPRLVASLNRDIAAYLATLVYRRGVPVAPGDPIALRYDRAQKLLAGAASGTIELVEESGAGVGDSAEAAVENLYEGDLFGPSDFDLGPGASDVRWQSR